MQRGTDIHAEVEHYLKTGKIRDSSYTDAGLNYRPYVESLSKHLPPPANEHLAIEQELWLDTPHGVKWNGYIDVGYSEISPITIDDIKSTSDFRYAKTPAELLEDIQPISYAKWTYDLGYEGLIRIGLIYVETKKAKVATRPRTKHVTAVVDKAHVMGVWDREMVTVERMIEASKASCAQDLPPTTSFCPSYGGCPHRSRCGIQATDISFGFGNTKGTTNMNSFLQKIKEKKASTKPNGETPTATKAAAKATKKVQKEIKPEGVVSPEAPSREYEEPEVEVAETQPAEKPAKKTRKSKAKSNAKTKEFTLYIDCAPTKRSGDVEPTLFEDWYGPLMQQMNDYVQNEKNLPSYLLLPYSEEKAMVAVAVQDSIDRLPSEMIMTTGTIGAKDALGFLIPHATTVVRAMR